MKKVKVLIATALLSLISGDAFAQTVDSADPAAARPAVGRGQMQAGVVIPQAVNASSTSNDVAGDDSVGCCGATTSNASIDAKTNPADAAAAAAEARGVERRQ